MLPSYCTVVATTHSPSNPTRWLSSLNYWGGRRATAESQMIWSYVDTLLYQDRSWRPLNLYALTRLTSVFPLRLPTNPAIPISMSISSMSGIRMNCIASAVTASQSREKSPEWRERAGHHRTCTTNDDFLQRPEQFQGLPAPKTTRRHSWYTSDAMARLCSLHHSFVITYREARGKIVVSE